MYKISLVAFTICCAATSAMGEEAFDRTAKKWSTCIGQQMKMIYPAPITIENVVKARCGTLKEQERKEYMDFITSKMGKVLSAETVAQIMMREYTSPSVLEAKALEIYRKVINKRKPNVPK